MSLKGSLTCLPLPGGAVVVARGPDDDDDDDVELPIGDPGDDEDWEDEDYEDDDEEPLQVRGPDPLVLHATRHR